MKTYRVLAKPDIRKAIAVRPALGESTLSAAIADLAVRELSEDRFGQVMVDVQLKRSTHEQALGEIAQAIEGAGYALLRASVQEWVSAEAQRAGIAAGTFAIGTGASKSPLVGAAVGVGATLVAEWAGLTVDRVAAEYAATQDLLGEWTLTRLPRNAGAGRQTGAGFSVA